MPLCVCLLIRWLAKIKRNIVDKTPMNVEISVELFGMGKIRHKSPKQSFMFLLNLRAAASERLTIGPFLFCPSIQPMKTRLEREEKSKSRAGNKRPRSPSELARDEMRISQWAIAISLGLWSCHSNLVFIWPNSIIVNFERETRAEGEAENLGH